MENITSDANSTIFPNTTSINSLCLRTSQLENSTENFSGELALNSSLSIDDTVNFTFNGLGLLFLAIVGVTANILSAIVLSHPRLKSSLNTLLLGLTISDTLVISTSFLIFSLSHILEYFQTFPWYIDVGSSLLLPWLLPIALTAQMSSVYFTVVITLERYIAVCLPLQARSICTRSSAKWSAIAVVIISTLYNIPRWFEFKAIPKALNCSTGEVTAYKVLETEIRQNKLFISYYINWAYLVFMYIVPFTILFYFNAVIYKQTKIHRGIRNSLSPSLMISSSMSEDIQLASMLFGIVITFIMCNVLAVAINLMENLGLVAWVGNLIPISNFLITLCCSTNFIFYCVFGTEFRRRLRRTLTFSGRRKSSTATTRSEVWPDKDNSMQRRQSRLASLQIPKSFGDRSRSNSNCSGGSSNNNSAKKSKNCRGVSTTEQKINTENDNKISMRNNSVGGDEMHGFTSISASSVLPSDMNQLKSQSTTTVFTIVSDEM